MTTLKKYFFIGTCTSGSVIFLYEILRPFAADINDGMSLFVFLVSFALFFTVIGGLATFFRYLIWKRLIHEEKMEEQDKHRQRH